MPDKSPAFQLYPDKAIAGTASLTSDAFKAYWLVLFWMWLHSSNHYTMRDSDEAWRKATFGIFPHSVLQNLRAEIMDEDAPLLKLRDGFLTSKGLKKEAQKQSKWKSKSRVGGLKSAEARRNKSNQTSKVVDSKTQPNGNITSTTPSMSSSPTTKKEHIEIVGYLNEVLGTKYRPSSRPTVEHINARISEGYGIADFKTVIDRKYEEWCGTEQAKFLRPETLFGTKFEGYLNAVSKKKRMKDGPLGVLYDVKNHG